MGSPTSLYSPFTRWTRATEMRSRMVVPSLRGKSTALELGPTMSTSTASTMRPSASFTRPTSTPMHKCARGYLNLRDPPRVFARPEPPVEREGEREDGHHERDFLEK